MRRINRLTPLAAFAAAILVGGIAGAAINNEMDQSLSDQTAGTVLCQSVSAVAGGTPTCVPMASSTTTTAPPTTTTTAPPTTTTTRPPTTTTTAPPTTTTTRPATTTTTGTGGLVWPDASNTGVPFGTTLTNYTGPCTITVAGTVIDSKNITCTLSIQANNVTVRRSRISTTGFILVDQVPGVTGTRIEDTEIQRPGSSGTADYALRLRGNGVIVARVNIHNVTSGIHLDGSNMTIQDSYIHDVVNISGQDHNDAIISNGGTSHVQILHNTLEVPLGQTTPLAIYPEPNFGGANTDWLVDHNIFNGGGYCIYPGYSPQAGEQPNTLLRVTNNVFGNKFYGNCGNFGYTRGAWYSGGGNTWTNNVLQRTGAVVGP
jgi:hypothetical protein